MGAWERAEAVQTELEEQYGDFFKKWFDADWERQMAEGGRSEALPSDLYRNTAGEIEARDAAKRRRLPPEERRLTLPDLGNENTVFAEGDGKSLSFAGKEIPTYLALNAAGGVDRYLKAAERGIETEDAAQAALAVSEIREEAKKTEKETEKKVPNLTLYREALRETRDMDAQMAALSLLMSEGEYARLETGVFRGITPELYVTARESIAEIDKNGSVSQDEAARAIGFMPGLTDEERAVLWQLQNKSWKPGKNPFSVKAGEKVYKDLQDGGGTLEQPEEELRGLELPRLE